MKAKSDKEIYFTPKQAAEYFNLSLSTIKNYIYADKLKTLKTPGGHHRIRKSELLYIMGDRDASASAGQGTMLQMEACCQTLASVFNALGAAGKILMMHSKNVSSICYRFSEKAGLTEKERFYLKLAGLLHDIGHIGSEKTLLVSRRPLSRDELISLQGHVKKGWEILNSIPLLRDLADIMVQHHERPDGRGYPYGLQGSQIHRSARILAIVEAFDSMISEYSYKRPISKRDAIRELQLNSGSQFDSDIVQLFVEAI